MYYKDKNYEFEYFETTYDIEPHPYLEIVRYNLWSKIKEDISILIKKEGIKFKSDKNEKVIISNNLAMWLARNITEGKSHKDPFFPYDAKHNNILVNNFIDLALLDKEGAIKFVNKLNLISKCNQAVKKVAKIKLPVHYKINVVKDFIIYKDSYITKKVFCPKHIYEKLKDSYDGKEENFNDLVFSILLRYDNLGGRSHQFAMETKFKDALEINFNCYFECFASAINFHYPFYCSLYYDLEKHFGSLGSFYNVKYIKGFFIANPPYEEEILNMMVDKFTDSLKESNKALSISFGLPKWGKYRKFEPLENALVSSYNSYHRCLNKEVYWTNTLSNEKVFIPEHCRFLFQNTRGKNKFSANLFKKLIIDYWLK